MVASGPGCCFGQWLLALALLLLASQIRKITLSTPKLRERGEREREEREIKMMTAWREKKGNNQGRKRLKRES